MDAGNVNLNERRARWPQASRNAADRRRAHGHKPTTSLPNVSACPLHLPVRRWLLALLQV